MSAAADQTRPYNKTSTLAPKLSAEDLNNLVTILPKLSEKEQVALLKELTDFEELISKETAQKDFLEFVKKMWPDFIMGRHHAKMAKAFERGAGSTGVGGVAPGLTGNRAPGEEEYFSQ